MPPSADASEAPEDAQRHPRHCWECQRRRIVCDRWRPVCNKCQTAGIVCPGYDNQKPLTWLAPGRVISRPRKRKSPPACRKASDQKEAAPKAVEIRGAAPLTRTKGETTGKVAHILELTGETIEIFEAAYYCKSRTQAYLPAPHRSSEIPRDRSYPKTGCPTLSPQVPSDPGRGGEGFPRRAVGHELHLPLVTFPASQSISLYTPTSWPGSWGQILSSSRSWSTPLCRRRCATPSSRWRSAIVCSR